MTVSMSAASAALIGNVEDLCNAAVSEWANSTLNDADLVDFIKKSIKHEVVPQLIWQTAMSEMRKRLTETGLLDKLITDWLSAMSPNGTIPKQLKDRLWEEMMSLEAPAIASEFVDKQVACYRLWSSGLPIDAISSALSLEPERVTKLLKRAKRRVSALNHALSDYKS